jgi:hypothetical protein
VAPTWSQRWLPGYQNYPLASRSHSRHSKGYTGYKSFSLCFQIRSESDGEQICLTVNKQVEPRRLSGDYGTT